MEQAISALKCFGDYNDVCGDYNDVCGDYNDVYGDYNDVCGDYNDVCGDYNDVYGDYNNVCGEYNNVCGDYNNVCGDYNDVYTTKRGWYKEQEVRMAYVNRIITQVLDQFTYLCGYCLTGALGLLSGHFASGLSNLQPCSSCYSYSYLDKIYTCL